nr:MAG TPA: hypothetical protein [Bacteriophage sp.]
MKPANGRPGGFEPPFQAGTINKLRILLITFL